MRVQTLLPHPAITAPSGLQIEFDCARHADNSLSLCYRLLGDITALRLPAPLAAPGPADGLWQHSCCELFVAEAGEAYREFNFSPSGEWAAYAFSGYRQRRDWLPASAPLIRSRADAVALELQIELPALLLPESTKLQLGISAVIEAADASLSYWALAHPADQPDFHRRESFVLTR